MSDVTLNLGRPEPGMFGPIDCGCRLMLHVWDPRGPFLPVIQRADGCDRKHILGDFDGAPARILSRPIPGWHEIEGRP